MITTKRVIGMNFNLLFLLIKGNSHKIRSPIEIIKTTTAPREITSELINISVSVF